MSIDYIADQAVYPFATYCEADGMGDSTVRATGLTYRHWLAARMMAALVIADGPGRHRGREALAVAAVGLADALIAELARRANAPEADLDPEPDSVDLHEQVPPPQRDGLRSEEGPLF